MTIRDGSPARGWLGYIYSTHLRLNNTLRLRWIARGMRLQASRVSAAEITIIPFRREALEYPALRDAPIYILRSSHSVETSFHSRPERMWENCMRLDVSTSRACFFFIRGSRPYFFIFFFLLLFWAAWLWLHVADNSMDADCRAGLTIMRVAIILCDNGIFIMSNRDIKTVGIAGTSDDLWLST